MGIRDLFRRNPEPQDAPSSFQTRPSYYGMAHIVMRQVGLEHPLLYLGVLASPDAQDFLTDLLHSLDEMGIKQDDFDVSKLRVHLRRVGEFPCAVVEFPTPRAITEVFYTALVVLIDPAKGIPEEGTKIPARYFTLELGMSLDETLRTVMGEWTDSSHLNHGDGPEPTLEAFMAKLDEMVTPGSAPE